MKCWMNRKGKPKRCSLAATLNKEHFLDLRIEAARPALAAAFFMNPSVSLEMSRYVRCVVFLSSKNLQLADRCLSSLVVQFFKNLKLIRKICLYVNFSVAGILCRRISATSRYLSRFLFQRLGPVITARKRLIVRK